MKLNKKQKEIVLSKIDVSSEIVDEVEHLYWNAGKASYNIGVKPTWTNDQKEYLDGMEDRLNKRIDSLQKEVNQNFDLLFKHLGIKR